MKEISGMTSYQTDAPDTQEKIVLPEGFRRVNSGAVMPGDLIWRDGIWYPVKLLQGVAVRNCNPIARAK